jgi:hypothetical protein
LSKSTHFPFAAARNGNGLSAFGMGHIMFIHLWAWMG